MTIETSLAEHMRTGKLYRVDVFAYPTRWQESPLGRIKMRLAYHFPTRLAEKVGSKAACSFDRREAQEKLPSILAACRSGGNYAYFGKVVEDGKL